MYNNVKMRRGIFCNAPFRCLMINAKGDCYFCGFGFGKVDNCLGNILEVEDAFRDIWNGKKAQIIRKSVLEGTYGFCFKDCGNLNGVSGRVTDIKDVEKKVWDPITQGINEKEKEILKTGNVCLDYGPTDVILSSLRCNLKCPSCREEFLTKHELSTDEEVKELHKKRLPLIKNAKQLIFGYTGEFTLNELNKQIMCTANEEDLPDLESIVIQSNGVLFTPDLYEGFSPYMRSKTHRIEFSVDAGTEETYKINRVGGNWNKLIENIEYIANHKGDITLQMNVVIQNNNYKEVPIIVERARKLNCYVNFQQIKNWGTFPEKDFVKINVFSEQHKNYNELIDIFKNYINDEHVYIEFDESIKTNMCR